MEQIVVVKPPRPIFHPLISSIVAEPRPLTALSMLRAILSGRGDEIVELARTNLRR